MTSDRGNERGAELPLTSPVSLQNEMHNKQETDIYCLYNIVGIKNIERKRLTKCNTFWYSQTSLNRFRKFQSMDFCTR
jgi:hypothetical protein